MARPRSPHVLEVKAALIARVGSDFAQPGGRFLSTRAVAQRFAVSYQTAHRLLRELETEGLLQRRAASGSYLPGQRPALHGVQLVFHPRAKRKGSFGAHLHELLVAALTARRIPFVQSWPTESTTLRLRRDYYPIVWECRAAIAAAAERRSFALCLNDHPPLGLAGSYVDGITTDEYSGGACAAELLKSRTGRPGGFVILGGPEQDRRSQQRIAGFRAHAADTRVLCADSWYMEAGLACAAAVFDSHPAGVFACNDRLAEALIAHGRKHQRRLPPLIGFDNAPIAEHLRLTTIGIPWRAMVRHAVDLGSERLAGGIDAARLVCLAHEPVVRLT